MSNADKRGTFKNDGTGFILVGGSVHEQWTASGLKAQLLALRPNEPPLRNLSPAEHNWLTIALSHLIRIDESRRAENAHRNSYCVFEAGRAYFQCLAPPFGTYLRCEAVSEKYAPELGAILNAAKKDRLVHEFGFTPPGIFLGR